MPMSAEKKADAVIMTKQAHAGSAHDEIAETPYAIFRRLDLGPGGYAAAPAKRAKTAVAAVISEKHGR